VGELLAAWLREFAWRASPYALIAAVALISWWLK